VRCSTGQAGFAVRSRLLGCFARRVGAAQERCVGWPGSWRAGGSGLVA